MLQNTATIVAESGKITYFVTNFHSVGGEESKDFLRQNGGMTKLQLTVSRRIHKRRLLF